MCRPIATPSRVAVSDFAELAILLLAPRPEPRLLGVGGLDVARRTDLDDAEGAVHDDAVAGFDEARHIGHVPHHRDPERPRHDGDVARRATVLEHEAPQPGPIVVEEGRRPHGTGHDHGIVGQCIVSADEALPGQLVQQPVGEFVEVVEPVAQVGVGLAHQLGAGVALHALDGGFGREARDHGFPQPAQPAAVMREHPERLQHLAMFSGPRDIALVDQLIDRLPKRPDRLLETRHFAVDVFRHEAGHDDTRFVQHGMSQSDAVRHNRPFQGQVLPQDCWSRHHRLQLTPGDHLRDQHGGRLQRLHLLLGIKATGPVLDHEDPKRVAAAQDRHAEEREIDLFTGFGLVGKGRVTLGIGQRQGLGAGRDEADQPLSLAHRGLVDGFPVEPLGRVELEASVGVKHVDRANLGHHVEGDLDHDLVEPRLRGDRLRHDLAKTTQQQSRSGQRATHRPLPSTHPADKCFGSTEPAPSSHRAVDPSYSRCPARTARQSAPRLSERRQALSRP